jgi:hypothetical protein
MLDGTPVALNHVNSNTQKDFWRIFWELCCLCQSLRCYPLCCFASHIALMRSKKCKALVVKKGGDTQISIA